MNIIKEFLIYRKLIKQYQEIELSWTDKNMLEAFDKDVLRKIINSSIKNLSLEMMDENITREYLLWYKQALAHLLSYFKKYNKQ